MSEVDGPVTLASSNEENEDEYKNHEKDSSTNCSTDGSADRGLTRRMICCDSGCGGKSSGLRGCSIEHLTAALLKISAFVSSQAVTLE
jgi:hypothetical protein